jgi:hypothetical protein
MKASPFFPKGTANNADFVTRQAKVADGEQVIQCDVDLETLPASGLLCLHEQTVRQMVTSLGWKLQSKKHQAEVKRLRQDLSEATARLDIFDKVIAQIESISPNRNETP